MRAGRHAAVAVVLVVLVAIGVVGSVPVGSSDDVPEPRPALDVSERVVRLADVEPIGGPPATCAEVRGPVCVVAPRVTSEPLAPTPPARPADRRGVAYGPEPHQLVDLWIPDGPGPHPTFVWLHGGGWVAGSRTALPTVAHHLAAAGWIVLSADYRLATLEAGSFPALVHDVHRLLDWLGRQAGQLRADPDATVLGGGSAGGHLALLAALTTGSDLAVVGAAPVDVAAVISFAGITDLPAFERGDHPWASALPRVLLGCGDRACDEAALRSASPTEWVTPDAPPVYLAMGAQDELVPPEQAWLLADRFEGAGGGTPRIWVDVVEDAGHNLGVEDLALDGLGEFLREATGAPIGSDLAPAPPAG